MYPIIEEYLTYYRPLLLGANDCDYVFRPQRKNYKMKNEVSPMCATTLSGWVDDSSKRFLPFGMGFRSQAYRHIIATDYIKNHPNGFQVVASILHDTLETVMKNYGHVSQADWFDHYNEYLDTFMGDFHAV